MFLTRAVAVQGDVSDAVLLLTAMLQTTRL
jgi:hypothetical protein